VFEEAARNNTAEIVQSEQDLVAWFEEQGNTVNQVDRTPFRDVVVPHHLGDAATWDEETYNRLQEIGQ
jgi:hypothetical protein